MKTLVIADDDLNCGKSILNSLEKFNKDLKVVGLATDGEETLDMISRLQPNFLILDLKMPLKNGIEVLDELKDYENCKTNVILISGERELLSSVPLMKYRNIASIISKPFDASTLYHCINSYDSYNFDISQSSIDKLLHKFTFDFSSISYLHLIKCIEKAYYRPLTLQNIYQEIAKENHINSRRIKWGIEKLISSMVRFTPNQTLKKYLPQLPIISPKKFIYAIVHILKENAKSNSQL